MGKKGSWFSAIKKVFTHNSKDKLVDGGEKKSAKEKKKKGIGKLKYGDGNSFIPLFREPSSIEKILGEAEREHQVVTNRPLTPPERPKPPPTPPPLRRTVSPPKVTDVTSTSTPPRAAPRAAPPPRNAAQSTPPRPISPPLQRVASAPHVVTQVKATTPVRAPSPRHFQRHRAEPTLEEQYVSAIKIQAAYRGYVARRSYRALRGIVRLQAVVKGQSVKRQTTSALKCMQLLVRVQTQIQSRRIQMLENQALQRQSMYKNDKDLESLFSKWNLSENSDEWDDSTLTKEEIEARMQRKVDAVVKRERAMAYAYSHQLWKSTPRTPQSALMDIRSGGFPYWWNWLDQRHHVPPKTPPNPSQSPSIKNFLLTPSRQTPDYKGNTTPLNLRYGTHDTSTPRSTRSAIPTRTKLAQTPPGRLQQKLPRGSVANSPFRDDDSLTSCPPFSVPRYMSPTVSANAKLRGGKEPIPDSPGSVNTTDDSKRRTSFPLGQEFKRNKGPFFSNKETSSSKGLVKNHSFQSIGNLSVDSTISMPATVGRKAFNRFA